ncbi:MAG: plasmid replication protein, CyRepA1 family, partial [Dolichospermum sp.]
KVLVCTDGQKLKSKYSTQNIEKLINKKYPHKKILIVDSHTISDPSNIAYGCVTQLNSMINQFDVVICSPSVGTGISIDIKGYVDVVYGIFQGVQGENAVRQQLMRLRDNCDRHLYISKTGMNFTGDGSTSLYMLSDCQHKQFKNHLQMLRNNGFDLDESGINSNDKALNCYLKMSCRINNEMADYAKIIIDNLLLEGNEIINLGEENNDDLKAEIKENKDTNYKHEREQIAAIDIDDLDDHSYEQLSNQKAKTIADKHREKKYSIKKRYQVEITPDLILFDDDGYYPQLKLHYYLTLGNQFVPDKDKKNAESIKNSNMVFLPDFNRSQLGLKVCILKSLGIDKLIERSRHEIFHDENQIIIDIANKARTNLNDIGKHIGKLSPDMTNISLVRKILKVIGYSFKVASRLTRSINGKKERYYTYKCVSIDGGTVNRELIFSKWYQSDTVQNEKLYQTMIQNSENQSDFSNINNVKNSDLEKSDLENTAGIADNTPQNCLVWDGLTGTWVGAILKTSEILINGTYKALVVFWNGLERYVWNQSHIFVC